MLLKKFVSNFMLKDKNENLYLKNDVTINNIDLTMLRGSYVKVTEFCG
jgi:hypothetical protein